MRSLFILLLLVGLSGVDYGKRDFAAQSLSTIPVDIQMAIPPTPVKANAKLHLLYELHLTNFGARDLELTRVDVLSETSNDTPLASYADAELIGRLAHPGTTNVPNKRVISGGMRAVLFVELVFNRAIDVPSALRHRLWFKATDSKGIDQSVTSEPSVVRRRSPPVIHSPIRGAGWVALSGMSNTSGHRRTIVVVNGTARIAQRFATDWVRLHADGLAFHGDPARNANWAAYGAQVHSVTDGTVVAVKDGIPENDPTADKKAVPITVESAPGNYVIVDMGNGYFSFYAHLKPNSIRVKIGDHLRVSQVLAQLGNSGNSDSPHLHFHISDGKSPLGAEGMPYVLDRFEMLGMLQSKKLLIEGGWKQSGLGEIRRLEIPVENAVVRFR